MLIFFPLNQLLNILTTEEIDINNLYMLSFKVNPFLYSFSISLVLCYGRPQKVEVALGGTDYQGAQGSCCDFQFSVVILLPQCT